MKWLWLFCLCFNVVWANSLDELKQRYQRPSSIPFPSENPYTLEKAVLGKMLFFDVRLSKHQNMSCASCHNPSFGWEGALQKNVGSQNTSLSRHSPTTINMAWNDSFFWDGRSSTLEDQALGPIQNPFEMAMTLDELVSRLSKIQGYQSMFNQAFEDGITSENIGKAIATFERTIVSGNAPFDQWILGDESAISEQAKQGFIVFNEKGKCAGCHTGWNFTDQQFHDIGLHSPDLGRYAIDDSDIKNKHAFKTPSLRNIKQRAPYMHDGSVPSLQLVIVHYIMGGMPRPSRSEKMQPVPLTQDEIDQLVAFLETLQGDDNEMPLPILPL